MTVQTREIVVVHRHLPRTLRFCPECRKTLWMVSSDEARQLAGISTRTLYRWLESGRLHYVETPTGDVRVCLESLQA